MTILTRDEVIERALRKIGAFAVSSRAPRAHEVAEASYWLDMAVAHQSARSRQWWLVQETAEFAAVADQASYVLRTAIGANDVPLGIQFVIAAYLYDVNTGQDVGDLPILRRHEYEEKADKARTGTPEAIYIDRQTSPTAYLYPTPSDGGDWRVRLVYQAYSADFVKAKPTDKAYQMRPTWNLWMVTELAAQIGAGPVRRLPADEVREMRQEATRYRNELEAYDAHEQADENRRVGYWNGID